MSLSSPRRNARQAAGSLPSWMAAAPPEVPSADSAKLANVEHREELETASEPRTLNVECSACGRAFKAENGVSVHTRCAGCRESFGTQKGQKSHRHSTSDNVPFTGRSPLVPATGQRLRTAALVVRDGVFRWWGNQRDQLALTIVGGSCAAMVGLSLLHALGLGDAPAASTNLPAPAEASEDSKAAPLALDDPRRMGVPTPAPMPPGWGSEFVPVAPVSEPSSASTTQGGLTLLPESVWQEADLPGRSVLIRRIDAATERR